MTDSVENLVLEHLRAIRADISAVRSDVRELKDRMAGVETGLGAATRHLGSLMEGDARLSVALDRLSDRVGRIERRLDINDDPPKAAE